MKTNVTFLLDRSASMAKIKESTIAGFNAYLKTLRAEKDAEIQFTLLQFDSQSLDKMHVRVPIADVPILDGNTFQPRAGTPLIDSCVDTIRAVEASISDGSDTKVIICFQTDGEENASRDHTWEELSGLVAEKQAIGWQFNFIGAGINTYEHAMRMNIPVAQTMSYDHTDKAATMDSFVASAEVAANFSAGRAAHTGYSPRMRATVGDRFYDHFKDVGVAVPATPVAPTTTAKPYKGRLDLTTPANQQNGPPVRKATTRGLTL